MGSSPPSSDMSCRRKWAWLHFKQMSPQRCACGEFVARMVWKPSRGQKCPATASARSMICLVCDMCTGKRWTLRNTWERMVTPRGPSSLGVLLQHVCIHNADLCSFTCYSFIVNLWFSFANRFLGSCWISLCVPWAVLLFPRLGSRELRGRGQWCFAWMELNIQLWICFNINKSTHTHTCKYIYIYTLIPSS